MSELKAYTYDDMIDGDADTNIEYYPKSEVDKVIAELKNGIAPNRSDKTLQERLNEVCEKHGVSTLQDLDWAFCESEKRHTKDNIEAAKVIAHHKYKRCLAMARMCEERSARYDVLQERHDLDWGREIEFYYRWYKRWLELAEKFKEAK